MKEENLYFYLSCGVAAQRVPGPPSSWSF